MDMVFTVSVTTRMKEGKGIIMDALVSIIGEFRI
jgi:hypothetical protein